MSVNTEQVRHIAKLARIAMSDAEIDALVPELNNILGWVEQLGEVDTDGVEPLTAVIDQKLRLRDDVVNDGDIRDAVLANAPDARARLLRRAEGDRIVTRARPTKTIAELRDGFRGGDFSRARGGRGASTPRSPRRRALNAFTVETPEDALAAADAADAARGRASSSRWPASRSASRICSPPRASTPPPAADILKGFKPPYESTVSRQAAQGRARGCSASSTWTSSRWARRTRPAPTAR